MGCVRSPNTVSMVKAEARLFSGENVDVDLEVDGCAVNYLEHVEAIINVKYSRRGALEIYLTSPQGTKVQLLSQRPKDDSKVGFVNWPMMSVATWGENPRGTWTLNVVDKTKEANSGEVGMISLILHGTHDMPAHMNPRGTSSFQDFPPALLSEEEDDDMDPTELLAHFEQELLRIHHRKNDMSQINFGF